MIPGFAFGLIAIVVASLMSEKPDEETKKNFDRVIAEVAVER